MLEDQPLDLSVRVGDYAEFARNDDTNNHDERIDYENREHDEEQETIRRKNLIQDFTSSTEVAAARLRGLITASSTTGEYLQCEDRNTCSEDSDDSCSDNNQKDGGARSRSRPPGTKPYKKNLMRRYREFFITFKLFFPRKTIDVHFFNAIEISIVRTQMENFFLKSFSKISENFSNLLADWIFRAQNMIVRLS